MPLHDHFHPPLGVHRPWQGFHSAWASALTHQLNHGLLPPHYFAMPTVQLGGQVEIDVATLEERNGARAVGEQGGGLAVWTAPRPVLAVPVDFRHLDVFEVQVFNDEDGPRLVAAIELVSPANKDRESHRRAFAVKCAAYLQQGISLAIVDAVTSRSGNLHAALLELLGLPVPADLPATLYAVSHRSVDAEGQSLLETWPEASRVRHAVDWRVRVLLLQWPKNTSGRKTDGRNQNPPGTAHDGLCQSAPRHGPLRYPR